MPKKRNILVDFLLARPGVFDAFTTQLSTQPEAWEEIQAGEYGVAAKTFITSFLNSLTKEQMAELQADLHVLTEKLLTELKGKSGHRARFDNLKQLLTSLPESQVQIALSLSEIGEIVSRKLPPTAHKDRTWWANTRSTRHAAAWMDAGWRLHAVYLQSSLAVFRRGNIGPEDAIPQYVRYLLEGTEPQVPHPDAFLLREWIRTCRVLRWYHEATVLYEKANWTNSGLSESELGDLEEHYEICKRELTRFRRISAASSASTG